MAVDEVHEALRVGRHVGLVRHHQHGDAAFPVERHEQVHDLGAALGVEVAGGLVGEQHGGLGDDGARDGDALLLSAGKLGGRVILAVAEPDRVQRLGRARRAAPPAGSPRYSSGNSTFSCADVRASRLKPWNTKPR